MNTNINEYQCEEWEKLIMESVKDLDNRELRRKVISHPYNCSHPICKQVASYMNDLGIGKIPKILEVGIPKQEQENSTKLREKLSEKKYQITFIKDGKERYAYADDSEPVTAYLKSTGAKILSVVKLDG